ncbi:thioredoxin family protein [Cohnella hashimotonis]|uniref:Thioredoxin n=1 Tax=Cohnella hashimotonis TaxID=2826895 RepID=A0ABT6TJR7_9BACL|nr:thioredoxin family protein [Cohnella hashimotonis]MDI4646092.1 thioredoxin family protein [Cohnella hashimotonis]
MREASDIDFENAVKPTGVTLVDFGATWCPPCKALLPIIETLAEEYGERVSVVKVDTDESPETASIFGVMSNPTVIVFNDGAPVEKLVGLRPIEVYRTALNRYV